MRFLGAAKQIGFGFYCELFETGYGVSSQQVLFFLRKSRKHGFWSRKGDSGPSELIKKKGESKS
jgi:hypothetical protein